MATRELPLVISNLHGILQSYYLRMTPEKALAKAEKKKKYLYLQACLESRRTFLQWSTMQTEYLERRP